MPIQNGTTIGVPQELGETIREIAAREGRTIVAVIERMTALYEPLTLIDHATLSQIARDSGLDKTGEAMALVLQKHRAAAGKC